MPATRKKKITRAVDAPKVKTIQDSGAVVNIGGEAKTQDKVIVLFRSRYNQRFDLKNGKSVLLNGNAVHLAHAGTGALPPGGYGITIVDADLWAQVKKEFAKSHGRWWQSGRIKEVTSENKAINYAIDHADDKTGDDPITPQDGQTLED